MTLEEIKIRRLANQYLTEKGEKLRVIHDLMGFQAQFMSNALHSMRLRCSGCDAESAAEGLVKNWTIRGTVHIFAEDDLGVFKRCPDGYRSLDFEPRFTWQRPDGNYNWYDDGGCRRVVSLSPERHRELSEAILEALADGEKSRVELKEVCRERGMSAVEEAVMFDAWGGGIRDLSERGFINGVVSEKKLYRLSPDFTPMPDDDAMLRMAERYFRNYAPATVRDAAYYFGIPQTRVKKLLDKLPVESAECGGRTYFYIEGGKKYMSGIPDCVFLAGFDGLMLGYEKKENVFLPPEHLRGIFNHAGIVMPAVLLRGEVAGKWRKKGGKLTVTPFRTLSEDEIKIIKDSAEKAWDDLRSVDINV